MILRDYQLSDVDAIEKEFQEAQSTLLVLPTGGGKTVIAAELIKRFHPKRSIFLAHRSELIHQAVRTIHEHAGLECSIEMADQKASASFWNRTPVVVGTVQTMCAGNNGEGRMTRFAPEDFDLLIADEGHHWVAPQFKRVLDYFRQNKNLKCLGITATPDRADESALGQAFETVAADHEILDLIHEGWLVHVMQQMVTIEGLDFSAIRTTAGDLNGADLAAVMESEKNLHGIASATLDIVGGRRTLVFTSSVKHAEMLCEIFNRHKAGLSGFVCGKTAEEERRKTFQDFSTGAIQILCNCGVATEGYDNPAVEVIIQARPTKSRCLYAQMVGRALRPLKGVVDGHEKDTKEQRKAAIQASPKAYALVVDFVGNAGRHKLVCVADVLGGKVSDEAVELARKRASESGKPIRMDEELDQAEEDIQARILELKQREAARKAHLTAKAQYASRSIDPFDILQITPARVRAWDDGRRLTEKQRAWLLRSGFDPDKLQYAQAKQAIVAMAKRMDQHLCSIKQAQVLRRAGYDTDGVTFEKASELITALKANNWRRPSESVLPPSDVNGSVS